MRDKNNKGFTLVELLVVIAIIGILAVVSVPALFKNINKAKIADLESDYNVVKSSTIDYYVDNNELPKRMEDLKEYVDILPDKTPIGGGYILDSKNEENKISTPSGPVKMYPINSDGTISNTMVELHNKGDIFLRIQSTTDDYEYISKDQLAKLIDDIGHDNIYISASSLGSKYQYNAIAIRIVDNILSKPEYNK